MTPLHCPRDAALLTPEQRLGQPWHHCQQCRGMFLPLALTPELRPLLDQIIRQASDWPRSSLACPQCGRTMHVAHYDAVEIDLCRHCQAAWLDKDEVDRVTTSRLNDEAQEQVKDEAPHAAVDELAQDGLAGALDWLGDALGALLPP